MQVDKRLGIDENPYIAELEDAIAFARLRVETYVVTQTGTATALYTQAQPALLGRNAFLGHCASNFGQGFIGNLNALRRRGLRTLRGLFHHCRHENDTPGLSSHLSTRHRLGLAPGDARRRSAGEHRGARPYCATAEVTGLALSCFFFQSPMAARIASSANTEQWIFTGGSDSSFTMSMFLMERASSTVLPLTHSVAREDEAIAEPQRGF